jgi:hypothetical protein
MSVAVRAGFTDPGRVLAARVGEFARARRRVNAARLGVVGLVVGGMLAALEGSAVQVFGVDGGVGLAIGLLVAPALVAAVLGWLQPISSLRLTLEIDRGLRLDERVTTAVELAASNRPRRAGRGQGHTPLPALVADQIADAAACLSGARPSAVYPLRLSRSRLALVGLALVLAVAPWFAPWPVVFGGPTPASQVSTVSQAEANRLDTVARRLDNPDNPQSVLDQTNRAQLAQQLRAAASQLRQNGANSQQSSRALLRSEQAAAATAPQTGEDAALTLARIADALSAADATRAAAGALDQQNPAQAAADLNQQAASLANLTAQQRQDLASALQAASNAARGSDTGAAQQLQQAAQAVQNGNAQGAQQAAQAVQQLGAASQAQRDAAQAQSELDASRQAIDQAAQAGQTQNGSQNGASSASAGTNGQSSGNQSSVQQLGSSAAQSGSPGDASQQGPGDQSGTGQSSGDQSGNQNGDQPGGGAGTGSANHLGQTNNDPQTLAERQVMVPTSQNAPLTSIGASNQLQAATNGQAQVDYQNVLPAYRQQALQAVENNTVPTNLRQVVKGYFDSLAAK